MDLCRCCGNIFCSTPIQEGDVSEVCTMGPEGVELSFISDSGPPELIINAEIPWLPDSY
jgi:hypothetical protein